MVFYVDGSVAASGDGSKTEPFKTIQEAANVALPGDTVLVYPGLYREAVDPARGGSQYARITYKSVEKYGAHITGAEPAKNWTLLEGTTWKTEVSNSIFPEENPFATNVSGDWYMATIVAHLGDVYMNEKSLYEAASLEEVKAGAPSEVCWDKEFSKYLWYAEVAEDTTTIYANFHGLNPNEENVEISVRRSCFYPSKEGCGYITLSGFKVSQAATQWAPPTAYQEGMVGPHWSKGWIIEDCEIYESKCSGISLGKYLQPNNDNKWLHKKYKDGTQTERDCICQASYEGWDKEHIGSHIVRNCDIHNCGQTGIVGHLGGVFSTIENNHIHHINNKQNLAGAEIGGIKMHAAIDVTIKNNRIHNCTRGIWLDWQAQGTRVTRNFFYNNCLPQDFELRPAIFSSVGEDIFVEVSHGPTMIDGNIMLSDRALKLCAQGIAVVGNLIYGSISSVGIGTDNGTDDRVPSPRYTPYHAVHGTKVAGFMTILHGDIHFHNNIFIQKKIRPCMQTLSELMGTDDNKWDDCNLQAGTCRYDGYPTFAEWDSQFEGYCGMGAEMGNTYYTHLPVWSSGNAYLSGAKPWDKEENPYVDDDFEPEIEVVEEEDRVSLKHNLSDILAYVTKEKITTETLGMAFEPEQRYESPDGCAITFENVPI